MEKPTPATQDAAPLQNTTPPATIYHYCSAETLVSVLSSRSIRLSALSLSNDTQEGRAVAGAVKRCMTSARQEVADEILSYFEYFDSNFDSLGFCLSEDGDLLSQWRAYADDGAGVAIGFSSTYLRRLHTIPGKVVLPPSLRKVRYEDFEHDAAVRPTLDRLIPVAEKALRQTPRNSLLNPRTPEELEADSAQYRQSRDDLTHGVLGFLPSLYQLKSRGFREEKEWRLLSLLLLNYDDQVSFRARGNRIVPYHDWELPDLDMPPIVEIVLGPKHITPKPVIRAMLRKYGMPKCEVRHAEVSYR